jgi:hypothetical protein
LLGAKISKIARRFYQPPAIYLALLFNLVAPLKPWGCAARLVAGIILQWWCVLVRSLLTPAAGNGGWVRWRLRGGIEKIAAGFREALNMSENIERSEIEALVDKV